MMVTMVEGQTTIAIVAVDAVDDSPIDGNRLTEAKLDGRPKFRRQAKLVSGDSGSPDLIQLSFPSNSQEV